MNGVNSIGAGGVQRITPTPAREIPRTDFGKLLATSIGDVNRLQNDADKGAEKLATGDVKSLHTTMIALEKAEVSLDLLLQVRNKIIAAYDEIKRMQI